MKKESINQFNDALNLDLHPMVTPNSVLTDNLNGTFITYNGNEFCLQNDRGNHSVAKLSEGYVPIGAKEYNGIIYIISAKNKYDENGAIIPWESITEIGTYPGVNWDVPYEEECDLNYNKYTALKNIDVTTDDNDNVISRGSFSNLKLGYTTQTPVTIEIQPSYDGSVNLILTDGKNPVRMINSGFSVLQQNKYKLIKRHQIVETNEYDSTKLKTLELIRNSTVITNVYLDSVNQGGQLKGGNYTFYIKFGDGDYNQTDIIAESGIISIFKGTDGDPMSVCGTLLDERTDKSVKLTIKEVDHTFSKIYVYYTREYSDTLGYRLTEACVLKEPYNIDENVDAQTIFITGFEQTEIVNIEELNIDYHTFDNARSIAQQQSMLFLGNLKQSDTWEFYKSLKNQTLAIEPKQQQSSLQALSTLFKGGSEYYSTQNIYNYVGYWPDEYYRFGIVYILDDGSTTPVFNVRGNINGVLNDYGVIKTTRVNVLDKEVIRPIYFTFDLSSIQFDERVKGFFVVRQKRIPRTICQGLSIGIDQRTHLPITWNGANWITESFLSVNRATAYKTGVDGWKHSYKPTDGNRQEEAWAKRNHTDKDRNNFDPTMEVTYNHTSVFKESGVRYKPDYLWTKSNSIEIDWQNLINPETGENYTSFQDWFEVASEDCRDGNTLKYYFGTNVVRTSSDTDFTVWKTTYSAVYKYDSSTDSYKTVTEDIKDYVFITENKPDSTANSLSLETHGRWAFADNSDFYDYFPIPHTRLDFGSPDDYSIKSELYAAEEDKEKFIVYGHTPTGITYANQRKGSGLLCLDASLAPTVRNALDGSEFIVRKEYDVTTAYGTKKDSYYSNTNNNSGSYLLISNAINNQSYDSGKTYKCVYVAPYTNIKTIDDYAFSTIAGNKSDVNAVSYTSEHLGVEWKDGENIGNVKTGYRWCAPTTDTRLDQYESGEHNESTTKDNNLSGFNAFQNINVIRGLFTPYIGITDNLDNAAIYSIRIKDDGDINQLQVRQQDESPYYTISKRSVVNKSINVFGGDCFTCTLGVRIITNFIDDTAPAAEVIVNPGTWQRIVATHRYNPKDLEKIPEVNISDINNANLGYWVTFKCLSSYNLGIRSLDYSHEDEQNLLGSPRSFFPLNSGSTATGNKMPESLILNDGYSATVSEKRFNLLPDVPYTTSEFANRIIFSNVQVDNSYANGYRVFQGVSFKDYDKQYGEIVKLVPWDNNLLVVMEHGIGLVGVNEQALIQTNTADTIHIYGHGVLSDHMQIISPDYGSKYEHSVIRTPIGVYGIDTDARKIWRVSTKQGFETLSDMKIESYLNDEMGTNLPVQMELCDVRTHYNETKGDIMFTFYKKRNKYSPSKETVPSQKEYFTISTKEISMSMNKTVSIPFSTNMSIDKISITNTMLVSAIIDFDNKVVKITAPNNDGKGRVIINGNEIPVKVLSKAEEFTKEQEKMAEETGTTTTTIINEETGEEETIVVPTLEIGVGGPKVTPIIHTSDWVRNQVYFAKNVNNVTLKDCEVKVLGVNADIEIVGQEVQWCPKEAGTAVVSVSYQGITAKSPEMTVLEGTLIPSSTDVTTFEGYTSDILVNEFIGSLKITPKKNTYAQAEVKGSRVYFTGLKEGTTSFILSDDKNTETINVTVYGDIPIEDVVFWTDEHGSTQFEFPTELTLHVGDWFNFAYEVVPTHYNPYLNTIAFDATDINRTSTKSVINYYSGNAKVSNKRGVQIHANIEGTAVFKVKIMHHNKEVKSYICNVTVVE